MSTQTNVGTASRCSGGIQGSKVCAKFPASMIFREKKSRQGLSGGAAGWQEPSLFFFFAGPVVGWPVKIFFGGAGQPEGLSRLFFRG